MTNKAKRELMINSGKEKIDETYYWLKATVL